MSNGNHTDIAIFDASSLIFTRLGRQGGKTLVERVRRYDLPNGTFEAGSLTPALRNPEAIAEIARRMKVEAGKLERIAVLLPDSWFRINIVEVPNLPRNRHEAAEVVRWSLKRSTPFNPAELRMQWIPIGGRRDGPVRLLVISALEVTLASIEAAIGAAGISVGSIEATGLNIWNAILTRDTPADGRVLVYIREHDFTTAVFEGTEPLFFRSRGLAGSRRIEQEIRLSASYLRPMLQLHPVSKCYVAGNGQVTQHVLDVLIEEFSVDVEVLSLPTFADASAVDAATNEAELIACRGFLTA